MGPLHLRRLSAVLVTALVVAGCAVGGEPPSTTTRLTTTSTTTTSTSMPTPTTTAPIRTVVAFGEAPLGLLVALGEVLSWRVDQRNPGPPMVEGLATPMLEMDLEIPETVDFTVRVGKLEGGSVAIAASASGDLYAAADEGEGWRVVGAAPAKGDAWFGDEPHLVLVLGSDARPGQSQTRYRADSIHLLTARASDGAGTIVGIPRDSYLPSPYGSMKLSSVMAGRGPEAITEVVADYWGITIDGYVVTGFTGFEGLMGELGNLPIVLPRSIPEQPWWPAFRSGSQTLSPRRVLEYARTRKGVPGGDFTRSANQGVVMGAMLRLLQTLDVMAAPTYLELLDRHTWTNLSPTALIQLAATAFLLDPDLVENTVLPGKVGRAGGGSVVLLSDSADAVIADLVDDGVLEVAE